MDEIYEEYFYKIYNWAVKKTNSIADAEDLTNNILLAIFQIINKNIKIEKLDNLIWKIAYNTWCTKAKEYIKDNQNINFDEEYQQSYDINYLDKIMYKEIINNLDNIGLNTNEKTSFRLYYIHDLSIKEIAYKMNTKESNIKFYLYNSRKKIKEKYYE